MSTPDAATTETLALGTRLHEHVLDPMKRAFVGKDEVVDLMGICLVGGENLFILGPPGTAKSALVFELGRRLEGRTFEYLLTRFTEPNELFGPFDIRKLREGELQTNTEGMLPEASLVFLDELLNANSAILNSLLMVLNERVFRRGRETRQLPTLMVVGASNHLPDDDALQALFDRFLVRVDCDNVPTEHLHDVLQAGWALDRARREPAESRVTVEDVRRLHGLIGAVGLDAVRQPYVELVHRLRHAGIDISDRRAVKLQRLIAASALLCGRLEAQVSDLWVLRYIWDRQEQREIVRAIVQEAVDTETASTATHPRAAGVDRPDAESLARDLDFIGEKLDTLAADAPERSYLRDRLGVLAGRVEWVTDDRPREALLERVNGLWTRFGDRS